ncbi:MAG: hypothetical protein K0S74_793 [Chlamydiales bacterium]|jgi:hypothetical protein|nr:hypothetical protein [Chlamydiales bacterium]
MVGFITTQRNIDMQIEHVTNPKPLKGDKAIVESVYNTTLNFFENPSHNILGIESFLAIRILDLPSELDRYTSLRELIDTHPLVMVMPNEVNQQDSTILTAKTITLGLNELVTIDTVNKESLASLKAANRSEIEILSISKSASNALNRLIKTLKTPNRPLNERTHLIARSSKKECCSCNIL